MRIALTLIALLGLSGCVDMQSLTPKKSQTVGQSYFLVDTKFRFFCLEDSTNCKDMTKIVSARAQLSPIEDAYAKNITGPNYPVSLTRIVLYPEDGSYSAKPIGENGRFYSIPVNPRTQIVWDTLDSIEQELFPPGN